uniref:Subtilisin-like protease SBT5.3 n=2 Tax=Populus alba TaxID=43335 RepID=A0A4U5P3K4_POPAL|nr:hypothetical protein D5086_0000237020 [Populus alba]
MGESSFSPLSSTGESSFSELDVQKMTQSHFDLLGSCLESKENVQDVMIYSYTNCLNGFAAYLNEAQVAAMKGNPGVISVFENQERILHTTHSWEFIGFEANGAPTPNSLQKKANFGEGVIIANLDTGKILSMKLQGKNLNYVHIGSLPTVIPSYIFWLRNITIGVWPESKSFNDEGMGPVPSRWKGTCQAGGGFKCNKKLIGARYFNKGFASASPTPIPTEWNTARDTEGHGSHTLSTAGGSFVPGAGVFGYGNGTAKGGSPKAHVAAYKVCWPSDNGGCFDADILAAFDAAIGDGVDVISMSLGPTRPVEFLQDGMAIGSFHAIKKGIPVVASAGNNGPVAGSVAHGAPWLFTIGASTLDREFSATVTLGNKKLVKGSSAASKSLPAGKFYPLINAAEARLPTASSADAQLCQNGTLDPKKVAGKIIVCLRGINSRVVKGHEAELAGAVGMILANDEESGSELLSDPHVLPAAQLTFTDGQAVMEYIKSTKNPTASISPVHTDLRVVPNPVMAAFSSRGPSLIEPAILKPDVTAPGVDVIAAYTEAMGPSELPFDKRRTPYITMSGTSMSCPHVSGIVGLLKAIHPDWSPAAIKSAIMTTAKTKSNSKKRILDAGGQPATPFAYGAGHVNPNLAADPGLVYDTNVIDYLNFLCARGYNSTFIIEFSGVPYKCPENASLAEFNYPSITVPDLNGPVTVTRRVKNVGAPGTYTVKVKAPPKVSVVVEPSSLEFKKAGEEKIFKVTFKPVVNGMPKDYTFGHLTWSDSNGHRVKSPLVVKHA